MTIFCRPFRAVVEKILTQAKAWAMLSWPFRPIYRGSSDALTKFPSASNLGAQSVALGPEVWGSVDAHGLEGPREHPGDTSRNGSPTHHLSPGI